MKYRLWARSILFFALAIGCVEPVSAMLPAVGHAAPAADPIRCSACLESLRGEMVVDFHCQIPNGDHRACLTCANTIMNNPAQRSECPNCRAPFNAVDQAKILTGHSLLVNDPGVIRDVATVGQWAVDSRLLAGAVIFGAYRAGLCVMDAGMKTVVTARLASTDWQPSVMWAKCGAIVGMMSYCFSLRKQTSPVVIQASQRLLKKPIVWPVLTVGALTTIAALVFGNYQGVTVAEVPKVFGSTIARGAAIGFDMMRKGVTK